MLGVDAMIKHVKDEFAYQYEIVLHAHEEMKNPLAESYINFALSYNLILNLIMQLMAQATPEKQNGLRELIEYDLSSIVDGPLTLKEEDLQNIMERMKNAIKDKAVENE